MKALAYFEHWSRRPGDVVRMAVSSALPEIHATFVKVMSGPGDPSHPRTVVERMPEVLHATFVPRVQPTPIGSYAELPLARALRAPITACLSFWPTLPESARDQVIVALGDAPHRVSLLLSDGALRLVGPRGEVAWPMRIRARTWYSIAITVTADGIGAVHVAVRSGISAEHEDGVASGDIGSVEGSLLRVATADVTPDGSPTQAFNGKVEGVALWDAALDEASIEGMLRGDPATPGCLARWDFSLDMASRSLQEVTGGHPAGWILGGAERGVTGLSWDGSCDDYRVVPEQYAAIQFHDDDMLECGWEYDLEFRLPSELESGVYGVRLEGADFEDCYPLFVPASPDREADVLLLFSTNTYLAYANDRMAAMADVMGSVMPHELVMPADEVYLHAHDELGRSCYDTHRDGSPVRYSSRRRPVLNVRPGYPNWLTGSYRHFPADLYMLEWVMRTGRSFHIATDEEVESDGADLFRRYKVIVTSSHPEYWTLEGLDALEAYLGHGGRIMYLGGNGFYWVTSVDPERPWIIEIRRDNSGTRAWNAPAGERTHVHGGMPGGLWRWRGRGPNTLLGVGFAAEGWNVAQPFVRQPASYEGPASTWFEGISSNVLGDRGYILGGVAGDEVDRFDPLLGSPDDAEILATATGFANEYQLVIEDQLLAMPNQGGADRQDVVRCDMVYFPIRGGGAVFSGSSIAYCGALAWNDFDNDLATVTTRVLESFCSQLP